MSISKFLKPSVYQRIYEHNKAYVTQPEDWIQVILDSNHKWALLPQLNTQFLKIVLRKLTEKEKIQLFRILCKQGCVSNIWCMVRICEKVLKMNSMACDYLTDFSPYKDNSVITYFYNHMDKNQCVLHDTDRLIHECVIYNNKQILDRLTQMTCVYKNKTLMLTGVKKRSIRFPIESVLLSIRLGKISMFEYMIQNETYYKKELSCIVSYCAITDLGEYITIVNDNYPLRGFFSGCNVVCDISTSMYHMLGGLVNSKDWFHYKYFRHAIEKNNKEMVLDCINQYPYAMCMRHHTLMQKSIGKPWYESMVTNHPCGGTYVTPE